MKNTSNILVIIVLCVFNISSFKISAQISDENTIAINQYFQKANADKTVSFSNAENQNNSIRNSSNFESKITVLQHGNFNESNVKTNGGTIGVKQVGDYNSYGFLSYYGRNDLNVEVQQFGNSNLIEIFGENSLIDNMKIIQKSSFKTITITNY